MTTTSRVPEVISYLVASFQAAATLGKATPPVTVIDGPEINADPGPLALWVGVDDIDAVAAGALPAAATTTQEWMPGLGRNGRTESLSIPCVAQAAAGDDDVASLRTAAAGIFAAVQGLVDADPSLGGAIPGSRDAGVTEGEWRQGPTVTYGMAVRVVFTVSATALLSSI